MTATTTPGVAQSKLDAKLKKPPGKVATAIFGGVLTIGLVYAASQLVKDVSRVHTGSAFPFVLLGIALLIALGFEFVNGFHDTANAVATVIYTHSLEPHAAVLWSGIWNFTGVLLSSGAVAFGIISLLPVELILQVGAGAGFAMVFALLAAAIIWNLGTWYFGLPSSSSHTLIGSIIGVGIANQLLSPKSGTSGVDWSQARSIGESLLISPVVGFVCCKRIVVTVGEKIGKDHLTYAQGAAAEITAMVTIGAADTYGLPVSTTHVLSSGVAGTMAANHSGLQMATMRNLLLAWVLTLPVSMTLAGFLFWVFSRVF